MSTRPPISVRRPGRTTEPAVSPSPIVHSPIPDIDPDAAGAIAFSMRGRLTQPETKPAEGEGPSPLDPLPALLLRPDMEARHIVANTPATADQTPGAPILADVVEPHESSNARAIGTDLVSVKLPPDVGRQLAAIADRRGSKRTLVAIEALSGPLSSLAAAHRAGEFPELPRVVTGTVRSSIAFALPPDLSADLDLVLRVRRAVRAQVVTRLLVPAIGALYEVEVAGRSR